MLKLLAPAILLLLSGAASSTETAGDYPRHPDWMKDLSDDLLIPELSIPGTHDSGADYDHCIKNVWCNPAQSLVVAQAYNIEEQLEMGVRFFDVRLAYENNDLTVHHGQFYLEQDFSDLCKWAGDFLSENPTEFVIFLIKQEHSSVSSDEFWQRVNYQITNDTYCRKNEFIRDKTIPKVSAARGKIILMARDYSSEFSSTQGFHLNWSDNTPHDENSDGALRYVVEDYYSPGGGLYRHVDTKIAVSYQNLTLPRICPACADPTMLLLTFLSAEYDELDAGPSYYAQRINPVAAYWLRYDLPLVSKKGGVVLMDFAGVANYRGDELIQGVIDFNNQLPNIPGNLQR